MPSSLYSDPALVRDVEDDAVRVAELALEVHPAAALQLAVELAAVRADALAERLQVVDDEAHVVDADEILAALVARGVVGMELEEREVDDAVGEGQAVTIGRLDEAHLLEAEGALVELRGALQVGDGDRDVPQLGLHGILTRRAARAAQKGSASLRSRRPAARELPLCHRLRARRSTSRRTAATHRAPLPRRAIRGPRRSARQRDARRAAGRPGASTMRARRPR